MRAPFLRDHVLIVDLRLARVRDDLLEFGDGQHARNAEFSDNKGRRAAKTERGGLIVVAGEDGIDGLGVAGKIALDAIDIDAGTGEQLVDARLRQFRVNADQRVMRLVVFVLEFARQRHPRRDHRNRPEDRPILQHQADLAVVVHHLPQLGFELAAIGALIVGPFDDGDVALEISSDGNVWVAQHQGFGQHFFIVGCRERRTRQGGGNGHHPTRAEQAKRFTPGAFLIEPGWIDQFGHFWSPGHASLAYTLKTGTRYAPTYTALQE